MTTADRIRVTAAYGGAVAMTPYLLIKVSWVAGALLGLLPHGEGFSLAGWVTLNTVTIVMAAAGIGLALALARPWGRRVPAAPLLLLAWVGTGFLVPMLPYLALSGLLADDGTAAAATEPADEAAMPGWEAALITGSFAGLGLGLAVALPLHLLRRHPDAVRGRLGDAAPGGRAAAAVAAVLSAAVGVLAATWAAGGTAALAHPETRTTGWYLLTGTTAAWALAGAAAALALLRRRPARLPRWLPVAVLWTASGMLAAWGAWKLPLAAALAANPALADPWPEHLAAAAARDAAGLVAGLAGLVALRAAVRRK
jgi:hypothetical protein